MLSYLLLLLFLDMYVSCSPENPDDDRYKDIDLYLNVILILFEIERELWQTQTIGMVTENSWALDVRRLHLKWFFFLSISWTKNPPKTQKTLNHNEKEGTSGHLLINVETKPEPCLMICICRLRWTEESLYSHAGEYLDWSSATLLYCPQWITAEPVA